MPHRSQIFSCLLMILLFTGSNSFGSNPQVSLLTCDPGTEMYSIFGHSAFRVTDTLYNIDRVYNYGIFDFNTPNFYVKFARGKLNYMLGVEPIARFMYQYEAENRSVYEQVLNLTDQEAIGIVRFLDNNYRPENRFYLYDFFYNNCATKLRDILETELEGKLMYPDPLPEPIPFREMLDMYTEKPQPWGDFGIDLILGLPTDKPADFRNQMFLPDFLSGNLALASINRASGTVPLMEPKKQLFRALPMEESGSPINPPLILTGLISLVLILLTFLIKKERVQNAIDFILFLILALLGIFWIAMWIFTDHGATHFNLNLLWTNPLFLLLVFRGIGKKESKVWPGVLFLAVFMLLFYWFSPQSYHMAVYPALVLIGVRAWRRVMLRSKAEG